MKKLFTTLLLLGAVVGTQAQVTVTDFDAETNTVTINYDRSVGVADEGICNRAIDDYFNPLFPGLEGQQREAAIRDAVSTIVLTGDWDNLDTNKDGVNGQGGKTIKKIVDKFSTQQSRDTLDLSACSKMKSTFVSVVDQVNGQTMGATETCPGLQSDRFDAFFTANYKLPDEVTTTILNKETTVKEVKIDNKPMKKENFDSEADYNAFLADVAATTPPETEYNYKWAQNPGDPLLDGTVKYYTAGTTIVVSQYYSYQLQSDGWYWIGSEDKSKSQKLTPEFKDTYYYTEEGVDYEVKNVDTNNLVANADGTYTYTQTVTHVDTPFAINNSYNIGGIIFPNSPNFTYIPDKCQYENTGLKKAVLSDYIVAIGNRAFGGCTSLEDVNFPSSLTEIGHSAFKSTAVKEVDLSDCEDMTRIRFSLFEYDAALTTFVFPPNIIEIQKEAFMQTGLIDADMQLCHHLSKIAQFSFAECPALTNITFCSHPKVIVGHGHGNGAFNNSKNIKIVEVKACSDVTDITQCICETGAFDFDVSNAQTQIETVEQAARLIFPRTAPVGSDSEYTSAFDFFVGDYKVGVPCESHEELLDYWYNVPNSPTGTTQLQKDPSVTIGKQLYAGNGWFEFINTGDGILIEDGKFLRTYSRTEGSGPVLLPSTITAYRAIDYASTKDDYIQTVKGGYVNIHEYEEGEQPDYVVFKNMGKDDQTKYKNYPRYALMTVKGQLLLRALRPLRGTYNASTYSWDFAESATESYVPENTGVVLYSTNIAEDAFLVFKPYTEYDVQFPEYPHTEFRYEEDRLDKGGVVGDRYNENENLRDDINMLQGSYGSECKVAPVLPWNWEKNIFYAGNKQYRNFGFNKGANDGNGGWIRLQPGVLRLNRAYAQIPHGRFNNFNESSDQMPTFTLEDHVTNGSNILVLGSSLEDEEVDGIQTIGTTAQTYEQDAWYTLQGVRVDNPTKGVYIHNNKKVVIK